MSEYLEVAIHAARLAGQRQRDGLTRPIEVREVTHHDVKLAMDVECEALIRGILRDAFPEHAQLGEEEGGEISPDTLTWIIDPLDGTVNYSRRFPYFCTSIAVVRGAETLAGVVYAPMTDELFTATRGGGAFRNGVPIHVSAVDSLAWANVSMGFAKSLENIGHMLEHMHDLAHVVNKIRIMGAAALDLSYVAAGCLDGFMERGLRTWDIAAGTLIVQEAGGRVEAHPLGAHTWNVRADNGRIW
jgi:myo-inositol-1(or 4)-monophosphatase